MKQVAHRRAGRIHAAARRHQQQRDHAGALQGSRFRRGEGLCAGGDHRDRQARRGGASVGAGQHAGRAGGLCQGQSGQAQLGRRRRHLAALPARIHSREERRQHRVRALQGRRARLDRRHCRANPDSLDREVGAAAADQERQAARARGRRRRTLARASRRADLEPGRVRRLSAGDLVRLAGAGENAAGGDRQAQCDREGDGSSRTRSRRRSPSSASTRKVSRRRSSAPCWSRSGKPGPRWRSRPASS